MSLSPIDAGARAAALDTSQSFCVSAPAGSGKTELLTQRLLKLLAIVEQPEAILAVTFTRKAAAEMRQRVVEALHLGRLEEAPAEAYKQETWRLARAALAQDQSQQWHLLENPARLKLQTMDSLCRSIAREQPLLSLLGGNLQPVDDARPLYEIAVRNFFAEVETTSDVSDQLATLLSYYDNNIARLSQLFVNMLSVRDQWLGHIIGYKGGGSGDLQLDVTLTRWIEDALSDTAARLSVHASELGSIADFAASNLCDNPSAAPASAIRSLLGLKGLPDPCVAEHKRWVGLVELLLTKSFAPRKTLTKNQGFLPKKDCDKALAERSAVEREKLLTICAAIGSEPATLLSLKTVASLPLGGYQAEQRNLLEPLAKCLVNLCAHLHVVFGQSRQCDHGEVASAALRTLGFGNAAGLAALTQSRLARSDEAILANAAAYNWNSRLQHILVDEFQDTSISQFYLLHALTADWPSYNAQEGEYPRSLFIVGDGMQSIYSFRQARVELFLRARREGLGELHLEPLELQQNFRSTAPIVNWINEQFIHAFPKSEDLSRGAVRYSPSQAFSLGAHADPSKVSAVSVLACTDDVEGLQEADAVVATIVQALQAEPTQSIAILVRARTYLRQIIPALEAADIAWQGTDIDSLARREVVIDCMTLASALLNPCDDLAWFSLLRAPWCGIELRDLQALHDYRHRRNRSMRLSELILAFGGNNVVGSGPKNSSAHAKSEAAEFSDIAGLSKDAADRLQFLANQVVVAWSQRGRLGTRQWLEKCWRSIGGPLASAYSADGEDGRSALVFFDTLELFEQQCSEGQATFSLQELARRVERLYAEPMVGALKDGAKPVQIMTIHKAKGLEFDTVILPGLARASRAEDKPLLMTSERVFSDGSSGLLLYPQLPAKPLRRDNKDNGNSIYEFLRSEDKLVKDFELTRLLYVAATRARSRLILLARLDSLDKSNPAATSAHAFDKDLFKPPARGSMLSTLWPAIVDQMTLANPIVKSATLSSKLGNDDSSSYAQLKRFDKDTLAQLQVAQKGAGLAVHLPFLGDQSLVGDDVGDCSTDGSLVDVIDGMHSADSAAGTCVHEILHLIGVQGLEEWRLRDLTALHPHWSLRLQQLGVTPDKRALMLDKVHRAINNVLQGDTGRWLFSSNHTQRACEFSLVYGTFEEIDDSSTGSSLDEKARVRRWKRSTVDTSFIDSNDCRWIIDYKTSEPRSEGDIDAFLQREEDKYREQLSHYHGIVDALLCSDQLGSDSDLQLRGESGGSVGDVAAEIRCALYFPLLDKLLEVDTDKVVR